MKQFIIKDMPSMEGHGEHLLKQKVCQIWIWKVIIKNL